MQPNSIKTWLVALTTAAVTSGCGVTGGYMPTGGYPMNTQRPLVGSQLAPTLPPGVKPVSLMVDPANANARVGESRRFNIQVKGSDGKIYTDPRLVVWSLSNPQLGTVDINGTLVPQMSGSVKVVIMMAGLTAEAMVQIDPARYAWQQVLSPTGVDLHAVKMVTKNDAWAAGDRGNMLRFYNGAWNREPTFNFPNASVKGLGFANTNLGWAVGSSHNGVATFVARWNGQGWYQEKLPVSTGEVNAISVLSERDVWAVGREDNGDALILHYDGFSWKAMQSPAKGKLNAVQMLSPKSGWAVGEPNGISTIPLVFKYQNGEWVKKGLWDNRGAINLLERIELTGIKMVSETQGYAVGISTNITTGTLTKPRGAFFSYNPKTDGWEEGKYDANTPALNQVPLYAIDMISGTEGWALGEVRQPDLTLERNPKSVFGNLLANVGGVLKVDTNYFSGNLGGAFYAIDLLPQGDGFVVGANGFILQRTYDWRGLNNTGAYGSSYGTGYDTQQQQGPITYGPGGTAVPGTTPVSPY